MTDVPLNIAVQDPANTQPTNKVQAASNASAGIATVICTVMATSGADAIREALGPWGVENPAITTLIIGLAVGIATFAGSKYGGQAAAYNVLDKPNIALTTVK